MRLELLETVVLSKAQRLEFFVLIRVEERVRMMAGLARIVALCGRASRNVTRLAESGDSLAARQPVRLYLVPLVRNMSRGRPMAILAGDTRVLMARCRPLQNLRDVTARAYTRLAKTGGVRRGLRSGSNSKE
jgi:hypothetical protein